jgi:hypothetical protein
MRTAVLIAATAAALTLTACNRPDEAATDASTEAAEASGAAVDTAATTGGTSGGANAASGAMGSNSGETMDPAAGGTVTDGAMTSAAQPGDTASNNVTETERRLNPPAPQ